MADTKITEKYEFKTDIITSYTGTEQRIALRNEPRHYLSYDYTAMKTLEAQWLRAVARMKQSTALYIPMWHTPLYLSEPALKDSRFIKVEEPLMFDARNCQAIEIFVEDTVKGTNKYYKVITFGDGGVIGLGKKLETDLNPTVTDSNDQQNGMDWVKEIFIERFKKKIVKNRYNNSKI